MVLSHYQVSMWFAYLLGFSNIFSIISFSWKAFQQEFFLLMIPPYTFLLEKIKEPPKGIISMFFDIIFVTGHFLYRLLRYFALILHHYSSLSVQKDLFRSLFSKSIILLHYFIRMPIYLLSVIIYILVFLYKLLLPIYIGYSPSHAPKVNHSIFLSDGITIKNTSKCFNDLTICAFLGRVAGTDSIPFDVDSFDIGMDNCASRTMSFCKSDFITPLQPPDVTHITGAGVSVKVESMGDIEYFVTDGNGVQHSLIIKNSLYVPAMPFRLMAVNQFAKQVEGVVGSEGTGIFFFWMAFEIQVEATTILQNHSSS